MKNILKIFAFAFLFTACEDLFSPAIENNLGIDNMYDDANYAQGILANGYNRIPSDSWSFNDVATDDAVSNDKSNSYMKMATGQWRSDNDPMERWRNCRGAIQYMNIFLAEADKVTWAKDELVSRMFNDRLKGEAYGLRAMFMYYLLQSHGGWSADGRLLGVPNLTEPETTTSDFNMPRATFEECMQQIYSDIEVAMDLLPIDFEEISSDSEVPVKYSSLGIDKDQYNRVFGVFPRLRMTARIAMAIRAQASLLAASPAYSEGNTTTWADAANYAAGVLDLIGGVSGLAPNGNTWYANTSDIDNLKDGLNPDEILWRGGSGNSKSLEENHFPPSLYGKGRLNPTQNLVDAFPMLNGYPIVSDEAGFDSQNPYDNRDPRLKKYILVNGGEAGANNTVINTEVDGDTNDAFGKVETSTRTGYYMRKLLRQDVNLNPTSTNEQKHYQARIRYTELFLAYAESANEAWGPMGSGNNSYSAYDVIKAIRSRAGIGAENGDSYLESVKGDKEMMRQLIRNERRLELCFEGFRFWDLRRWKSILNETASGMKISKGTYTEVSIENRLYDEHMYHGPIPYSEVLKFDALIQNKGW